MDIFFYEAFDEEQHYLRQHAPADLKIGYTWKTIQEDGAEHPPAPIISIRTQSLLPPAWANKLTAILTRSTGFDHLQSYLTKTQANIAGGYLPLYCNRAVAEQALLLWLALMRKLRQQTAAFKTFHRDGLTGRECEKKTLLVVGVGQIGSIVYRIGQGLDMHC